MCATVTPAYTSTPHAPLPRLSQRQTHARALTHTHFHFSMFTTIRLRAQFDPHATDTGSVCSPADFCVGVLRLAVVASDQSEGVTLGLSSAALSHSSSRSFRLRRSDLTPRAHKTANNPGAHLISKPAGTPQTSVKTENLTAAVTTQQQQRSKTHRIWKECVKKNVLFFRGKQFSNGG